MTSAVSPTFSRSASGLSDMNMKPELTEPLAAGEGDDVLDAGVFIDDVDELKDLFFDGVESDVLLAADLPADAAGVLLREEAFGDEDEEVDGEAKSEQGDEEDEGLAAEHPAEAALVLRGEAVEGALAECGRSGCGCARTWA